MPSLTLMRARALLAELIIGFSSRSFQSALDRLAGEYSKDMSSSTTGCSTPRELSCLGDIMALALTVYKEVLPIYGFEGTERGVEEMAQALQPFSTDPRIGALVMNVRKKLRLPSYMVMNDISCGKLAGTDEDGRQLKQREHGNEIT
eukprot:TRINITY_DN95189_c0_g1_i1.p1 TRINITY_DN95189_c0_g1~~TRINITY_DN95189_c0_g1_i1.p1  ORF type:complete len:147 (-),score=34.60 TRINITY_DN95189_c0_g1_i1:70-510(-)